MKRDQKTRGRFPGGRRPFGDQAGADRSLEPFEDARNALLAMRRMQQAGKNNSLAANDKSRTGKPAIMRMNVADGPSKRSSMGAIQPGNPHTG
jgi:hypothetical protein